MQFDIVLADPPWPQNARDNTKTRFGGGAQGHYPLMKLQDIANLPVEDIMSDNSLLLLWTTGPKLSDAMYLIEHAWRLQYVTIGFTWMKQNKSGQGLFFGVGYYSKHNAELCLLARKGHAIKPAVNSVSSAILSPIEGHSKKPDEVHHRIELMYPTQSKLELFARQSRPGWVTLGNELDGKDIYESMEDLIELQEPKRRI